jgi:hypothetical protein
MGTDAGGAPPTRSEIELEARSRPTPSATPAAQRHRGWLLAAGVLVLLLLVVIVLGAA